MLGNSVNNNNNNNISGCHKSGQYFLGWLKTILFHLMKCMKRERCFISIDCVNKPEG